VVFWGSLELGFNGFSHNPVEYAAAVTCPALLLHGDLDSRATPDEAAAVFAALHGPKQMISFPQAGHELLIGDAPDQWRQAVGQFLVDLRPAP
jgi:dipeptidyl aminopeptidase/acylaminoacyl peptidase